MRYIPPGVQRTWTLEVNASPKRPPQSNANVVSSRFFCVPLAVEASPVGLLIPELSESSEDMHVRPPIDTRRLPHSPRSPTAS
ncbi:hypothetical protein NMY22_g4734 [Coprinellus aureogranulatus]|nr:hypothetical protein NMY22_g4734 [Coprinellus aureogranulatus]